VRVPILFAVLLVTACAPKAPGAADPSRSAGRATDFSLSSVDGKTVHLSDYLGKDVVLLSFWATWCAPCVGEMPKLEELYQRFHARGFTVLSISMDGPETISNVDSTVRRLGVTYPVLLDEETRVVALYNPARDAPFTLIIGKDGRIAESRVGYAPGDEKMLADRVESLLAASASPQ
jgi:peroxiredoxin